MVTDWSRAVQRDYSGSDVRFDLPVRPLGWGRLIAVFLIGFGLLFVWSPGNDLLRLLLKGTPESSGSFDILSFLFSLPFLIGGMIPIGIGLLILVGRCRVEWREGRLLCTEMIGPLRWTRKLPTLPVSKLEVSTATSRSGNAPPKAIENFSGIAVLFTDGSRKLAVLGYPKDWMLGLAEELRTYMASASPLSEPLRVEVVEKFMGREEDDDDVEKLPAGSSIQLEERGAEIRIVIPPAGIWKGSKGLLFFSLLWCGFMAVFTSLVFTAGTSSQEGKGNGPVWVFAIFILVFWGVGIGMLLGALNMGRRTAELTVDSGGVRVVTKGLFGQKTREWRRGEIAAIRADASGMEVNNRPVIELQIHPVAGKKAGLLGGRDVDELRWIATQLRRALKVRSHSA